MKRKINQKTLTWLYKVSGKEKWNIFFLVLVQAFLGISTVLFAWLLRGGIDCAVEKNRDGFLFYSIGMTSVILLQILARSIKRFLDEYAKSGIENRFKARLFQQLLTRDYAHVTAVHSGEWLNRLTSDVVVVAEGMTVILPDVVGMSVKLAGAVTALLLLVPELGFLIVPGGIFILVISTVSRRILKKLHVEIQEADGNLRVQMSERLSGLLIVRTFARERQTLREAEKQMQNHRTARMKRNRFSILCNAGFSLAVNVVYMVGVLYCGYGILMGTVSYGSFTAVLQLIGQIQSPFASLTSYLPKFYAMLASAERLMEAEEFEAVDTEPMLKLEQIKMFYNNHFSSMGFCDITFTYLPPVSEKEQDKTVMPVVLKNLNLKIQKGECIAFTGPSGSGKSTILKLLMCLYHPDSGTRYLETADGSREALEARYTRLFAYVPQGNHLMSGTIREMVAFSDKEKVTDDAGIRQALKIACALEFVDELPEGLDTKLGERGAGLSEGQIQRIAIARAIYSGNPILVLDEATSALDEATEQRLVNNLRQMTNRTVLLVTHRPALLELCNRQVVLGGDRMEVIEYGTK